ncbi:MAG: hypothetical protein QXD70_03965 [Candidatus Bathyarchaeia archaeon]
MLNLKEHAAGCAEPPRRQQTNAPEKQVPLSSKETGKAVVINSGAT